jgi:hypothetical protein
VSRRRTQQPLNPGHAHRMGVTVRAFFERFDANAVKVRFATSPTKLITRHNAVRARSLASGCSRRTDARCLVVAGEGG